MPRSIIVNAKANVLKAAVIDDKSLDNLFIDKNESNSLVGNIYIGKIDRVLSSIQAAFIDIGIGKNGFLQLKESDFEKKEEHHKKRRFTKYSPKPELKEGNFILVQVVKEEIGTKGVRLETEISLPGRFLVMMPYGHGKIHLSRKIVDEEQRQYITQNILSKLQIPDDMDVIIRTAAMGVKSKYVQNDFENLSNIWKQVEKEAEKSEGIKCVHEELDLVRKVIRDWLDENVESIFVDDTKIYENIKNFIKNFSGTPKVNLRLYKGNIEIFDKFGITRQIEKLYEKKAWLKCGGYLVIEKTEALVAIDVNTGKNVKHASNEETIFETNLQAAEEIARQLRLRNMGGMVIIDFIDMKNRNHQRDVLKRLSEKLEKDKAKTKIYPFTKLGLVQMTRQRVEEAWEQHFFIDCTYCGGTGRILSVPVICEHLMSKIRMFLVSNPKVNINIRANSAVIDHVLKNKYFDHIEKQFGIEIGYLKDDAFHSEKYVAIRRDNGASIFS